MTNASLPFPSRRINKYYFIPPHSICVHGARVHHIIECYLHKTHRANGSLSRLPFTFQSERRICRLLSAWVEVYFRLAVLVARTRTLQSLCASLRRLIYCLEYTEPLLWFTLNGYLHFSGVKWQTCIFLKESGAWQAQRLICFRNSFASSLNQPLRQVTSSNRSDKRKADVKYRE